MYANGKNITLKKNITIAEFLKSEEYDIERVAVEKNGVIVPKKAFATETLSDDDKIEIVHFVGGG